MKLSEMILDFKRKHQVTNDYIAEAVGVSKSAVSKWVNGEILSLKGEKAVRLSQLLGYDVDAYLKGVVITFEKPILGEVKAGYNLFAQENYSGMETVTEHDHRLGDYFLHVVGNSMEGAKIHHGDLVYVKSVPDVASGDIAVVLIGREEVTIKKIIKAQDSLILEAANVDVPTRVFSKQEVMELPVEIIGKVIYSKTMF